MCLENSLKALELWSMISKLLQLIFITYNGYLLIITMNIDLIIWKIEDGKITNTEH